MESRKTKVYRQKIGENKIVQIEIKRELTDRKLGTGVQIQKVGELEFTNRKQENWI